MLLRSLPNAPEHVSERLGNLAEQCRIELRLLEETVAELHQIMDDIRADNNTASLRNRAAAANLSQSFYNGIENILKRVHKYHGVPLPTSEQWHSEIAERFTIDHHARYKFPLLLPPEIASPMTILRRFRHVIMHGYAMNLDWERMCLNVEFIPKVFPIFCTAVEIYLADEYSNEAPTDRPAPQ
jgi:hypothetical protein